MPTFTITKGGRTFDVEAPDQQRAEYDVSQMLAVEDAKRMGEAKGKMFMPSVKNMIPLGQEAVAAAGAGLGELGELVGLSPSVPYSKRFNDYLDISEAEHNAQADQLGMLQTGADIIGGAGLAAPARAVGGALTAARAGANAFAPTQPAQTLGREIMRGAGIGAGLGAAYGAGEGRSVDERLENAKWGLGFGGVAGGAGPAVVGGTVRGAQALGNKIKDVVNPNGEARRMVSREIAADINTPQADYQRGLTPQEFQWAEQRGYPVRNIDRGGENVTAMAEDVYQRSPGARAAFDPNVSERQNAQFTMTEGVLSGMRASDDELARRRANLRAGRDRVRNMYETAYQHPGARQIWSTRLQDMSRSPMMKEAMERAAKIDADEAAIFGREAMPGRIEHMQMPDGTTRVMLTDPNNLPDLRYWDNVKKGLDEVIESHRKPLGDLKPEGRRALDMKRELVDMLDEATTDPRTGQSFYAEARRNAQNYLRADSAAEAGRDLYRGAKGGADTQEAILGRIARWTDDERAEAAEGFLAQFQDDMRRIARAEGSGHRDLSLNFLKSRKERAVAEALLGPERLNRLEAHQMLMRTMSSRDKRMQGNSATARRLLYETGKGAAGGAIAGGGLGYLQQGAVNPGLALTGAAIGGTRTGGRALIRALRDSKNARLAPEIARILMDTDPQAYAEAVNIAANDQRLMNRMRLMLHPLRIGAGQYGAQVNSE